MDDLNQSQMDDMSMEDLQKLLQGGGESPAEDQGEQTAEGTPEDVDAEAQAPQAETPTAPVEEAAPRGVPDDRFAQMREQARALEEARQQLAAYEAALADPERVRAHLASIAPGDAPSFDEDPDAALEARLAPVLQRMQALEAENNAHRQRAAHQQMLDQMHAKHGPDFGDKLAMFDQANPHFAQQGIHPELRYFAAKGLEAASQKQDPAALQAQIDAAAEAKLAKVLASGGAATRGIPTLGNLPAARESKPATTLDSVSQADMERMSVDDLKNLLRG